MPRRLLLLSCLDNESRHAEVLRTFEEGLPEHLIDRGVIHRSENMSDGAVTITEETEELKKKLALLGEVLKATVFLVENTMTQMYHVSSFALVHFPRIWRNNMLKIVVKTTIRNSLLYILSKTRSLNLKIANVWDNGSALYSQYSLTFHFLLLLLFRWR